jgi:release factor glutamine methyltransferase
MTKETMLEYLKKYLPENKLEDGINQLNKGASPQYIVGNVDFYGNIIKVDKRVLIPRFETELLVEKTITYLKKMFNDEIKIIDIGTGSGCISITLKKELSNSIITASDISTDALNLAKENAQNNNTTINFIESDVFSNITGKFDCLISNPPYISYNEEIEDIVKNNEPSKALYAENDGLYFSDKILKECPNYLNKNFLIAFEIGYNQGTKIKNLATKYLGKNINISIEKDYSNKDRFVFIWN